MSFPVGQKVRGYGLVNEFGEFDFIPEQTGIREGQTKLVKQGDNYSITTTKKLVIVHMRFDIAERMKLLKNFFQTIDNLIEDLKKYDF